MRPQRSESPMFWATIGAGVVLIGSIIVGVGTSTKGSKESIWAVPAFDGGLVVVLLGVVIIGYAVYRYTRRPDRAVPASSEKQTIGLLNRPGGVANASRATFGQGLGRAVDNAGEVDVSHARFNMPPAQDEAE